MGTELISDEDEYTFKENELAARIKKVNKKGKERNYCDEKEDKKKDRNEDKENDSRRSRERDKDRDRKRSRRPRPKELPRYDVRTVIAKKRPKVVKDPFDRDVTPKSVSKNRSRSHSRSPAERRREMSISLSSEPPRRYNRRRSMSPSFRERNRTPPGYFRRSSVARGLRSCTGIVIFPCRLSVIYLSLPPPGRHGRIAVGFA